MSRVIAVQEEQLKMLKENYENNKSLNKTPLNVANSTFTNQPVVSPQIPNILPIDMESNVVNLNQTMNSNEQMVTSVDATNEVFGSNESPVINETETDAVPSIPQNTVDPSNIAFSSVPYKEPIEVNSDSDNVISADDLLELLNGLRNMVTDFANKVYSAIDEIQEKKLQTSKTGANLVSSENLGSASLGNVQDAATVNPETPVFPVDNGALNIFDNNQSSVDLDKTVVLPADFIANNTIEADNQFKMTA